MKKIFLIFILLCFAVQADARGAAVCGGGGSSSSCTTSAYTGAAASDTTATNLQYDYGAAVEFQATGTDSPCKIEITLACSTANCTDSGNFTAYIWESTTPDATSGFPSTAHSTSGTVAGSTITSSAAVITFTIASPSALVNGKYYFVGFLRQTVDSTSYPIWSTGGWSASEVMVHYTTTPAWDDLLSRDGVYTIKR